jgi:cobalt-zinc-cadmium efflux system protein
MTTASLDRSMIIAVALNAAFVVVELAAGFWAGSLALLADAGHNASDIIGLLLAWGASWLARRPPSGRYTWGLRRSTIYAALVNALILLAACAAIVWEAAARLREPAAVAGPLMIVVALAGVVINTFTALLFLRGHRDANIRGAFLHMAADAAVSLGVAVAGLAILATGLSWIDPVVSIVIALVIVVGTWGLLQESVELALDAAPRGVEPAEMLAALAALPEVIEPHDLHVWGASTSEVLVSVHLVVAEHADRDAVLAAAQSLLHEQFGVTHAAVQVEGEAVGLACPQRPADVL